MGPIEMITSVRRRRRWPLEETRAILEGADREGKAEHRGEILKESVPRSD